MTTADEKMRTDFEQWYVENAFDYPSNPIGSRDCGLQRKAWQASAAQYSARLKELEQQNEQLKAQVESHRNFLRNLYGSLELSPDWSEKIEQELSATSQTAEAYKRRIQADAWQPIETAPKDGRHIQLYRPEIQFVGYYGGANSGWRINSPVLPAMHPEPTHWMPLHQTPL